MTSSMRVCLFPSQELSDAFTSNRVTATPTAGLGLAHLTNFVELEDLAADTFGGRAGQKA